MIRVMSYTINVIWDDAAKVWVATSEDIPGLVLESDSYETLKERVKTAALELLELNNRDLQMNEKDIVLSFSR